MIIKKLDHVNIMTTRIEETIAFYTEVLGMRNGPLPTVPGMVMPKDGPPRAAWIYDSTDTPVLHLQAVDPKDPDTTFARIRNRLGPLAGDLNESRLKGSASIEHVAFECVGHDKVKAMLEERGLEIRLADVASIGLKQIFVNDPNGILLELNFRPGE